ncbi:MAG: hypothetical protein COB15_01415 [Flavobacteriales bacterium]|nr:MAG: hypothetical protein COB15_01415 [Flavobacteriales bacterium]
MRFQLNVINDQLPGTIDIFICNSSFEERSLAILKQIDKSSIKNAIICSNQDQNDIVGENANTIVSLLNCPVLLAKFNTEDPLTIADQLIDKISALITGVEQNIVVDVTTFTHEALLILLKIFKLNDLCSLCKVTLLYNSASSYCSSANNADEVWLSKGLKDKRTILGYPGRFKPNNSLHLIMLVGFEVERAKHLIEAYESDKLSIGMADKDESVEYNVHEVNLNKYEDLKVVYNDVEEYYFSCIDPVKTAKSLNEHINKFENHNVVLSPMNNKISTIGCALLAINKPEIQVISSRANVYNTVSYSEPSEYFYKFDLEELLQHKF